MSLQWVNFQEESWSKRLVNVTILQYFPQLNCTDPTNTLNEVDKPRAFSGTVTEVALYATSVLMGTLCTKFNVVSE